MRLAGLVAGVAASVTLLAVATPAAFATTLPSPTATPAGTPTATDASDTVVLVARADPGTSTATLSGKAEDQGGDIRASIPALGAVSFTVPKDQAATVRQQLDAQPGVKSVSAAVQYTLFGNPNDTYFASKQASYLNAITAPQAWAVQPGSSAVKIAVIDTGFDTTHPDLAAKIVARYNATDGTTDVTDKIGHGTFVAGVAAAATNNGQGIAGAGDASSIMAVKVADQYGNITSDAIANGLIWAADHGAKVINLSLGSNTSDSTTQDAVTYAQSHGAVVVAAAGNDGQGANAVNYPAGYPNVIAVGATDGAGTRPLFSEYGPWITVAAPGVNIYGTTPLNAQLFPQGTRYSYGDGTSFAAPLVAGEVALLAAQSPGATPTELRDTVVNTAHGYAELGLGTGQVDFRAALESMHPATAPTVTGPPDGSTVSGVVTLAATTSAPAVRFRMDGSNWLSNPVAVKSGSAQLAWNTWGWTNATHTIDAFDCTTNALCAAAPSSATVTVANATPALKTPASNAAVSGGFTMSATATGGAIAFLIDGVKVGFDATAPYSVGLTASALTDGAHTASVVQCSLGGTACNGPSSAPITFNAHSVRPTFTSATSAAFSPNGDKKFDTARITFQLPGKESALLSFRSPSGASIRTVNLGSQPAGVHTWTWDGRSGGGARLPDGRYSLTLMTTQLGVAKPLRGQVTRAIVIDTSAPTITAPTGVNSTFYPIKDGYGDTIALGGTTNEASLLQLTVRNDLNALAKTVSLNKPAGANSLVWNGTTSGNRIVGDGKYKWMLTATDGVGNVRSSPYYWTNVSPKKLDNWYADVNVNGESRFGAQASPSSCGGTGPSSYPHGVLITNHCLPQSVASYTVAYYRITLPAAVHYTSFSVFTAGHTVNAYPFTALMAAFINPDTSAFETGVGPVAITSSTYRNQLLGTVTDVDPLVSSSHVIVVGVAVRNDYGGGHNSFDLEKIQIALNYQVLE